jgi:hypothetical protein
MTNEKLYDIIHLQKMDKEALEELAKDFGLEAKGWFKQTIIYSILDEQNKKLEQDGNNLR